MTNPLAETITMPRQNYTSLVTGYCRTMQERSDQEAPRAIELRTQIEALIAKAKEQDVMLDDESVKKSPAAAAIREEMDAVLPEFKSLAEAAQKRIIMIRHLRERTEEIIRTSVTDVKVTTGEAMVLLNLAEPNIEAGSV